MLHIVAGALALAAGAFAQMVPPSPPVAGVNYYWTGQTNYFQYGIQTPQVQATTSAGGSLTCMSGVTSLVWGVGCSPAVLFFDGASFRGDVTMNSLTVTNADIYEDLRFPATYVDPVGVVGAATLVATWGPASNQVAVDFSATAVECAFYQVQFPHGRARGTPVHVHAHMSPHTTNTGDIVWRMYSSWADLGGYFSTQVVNVVTQHITPNSRWAHLMPTLAVLPIADTNVSAMLSLRLERVGNDTGDTFVATAPLLELDVHTRISSLGGPYE